MQAPVKAAAASLRFLATSTTENFNAPAPAPQRADGATAAGSLTLGNGVVLNGTDAFFDGDATITLAGVVSGSGNVNVLGPGNVILGASPALTGNIVAAGGTLFADVAIAQQIWLQGNGTLRGSGPLGSVSIDDSGLFFPGMTSAPVTVAAGDLTISGGRVELGFSSGNAAHSIINASGIVALTGGTLKLDFATTPSLNTSFAGLINSAGGQITGCFARAIAQQMNLIVQPLCSATTVSAKVIGNDRVFADGLDF